MQNPLEMMIDGWLEDDQPEQTEWAISDDGGAEWALQKVKEAREQRDAQVAHHQRQIEIAKQRCADKEAYMSGKLAAYFQTLPRRVTKTQESYTLPSGKLVLKHRGPKFEQDDKALAEWLLGNGHADKVKMVATPMWCEFKPLTSIVGESVVVAETGEVVPGIVAVAQDDVFRMEV